MSSVQRQALIESEALAADLTGDKISVPPRAAQYIFQIKVRNGHPDTTIASAKVQHSAGDDVWFDLVSFTGGALGSVVGTDAAEALSDATHVNATAHIAAVGDLIRFTAGPLSGEMKRVLSKSVNQIVTEAFSGAPAAGNAFEILRQIDLDELKFPANAAVLGHVRGLVTLSGTNKEADVTIAAHFDPRG